MRGELLHVKRGRGLGDRLQALLLQALFAAFGVLALIAIRNRNASLFGERARRLRKGETFEPHHERQRIARLLAAEAVKVLPVATHVERRRLLAVKRTQTAEIGAALLQGDVLADQRDDVDPFTNFSDELVSNQRGAASFRRNLEPTRRAAPCARCLVPNRFRRTSSMMTST